MAVTDRDRFAYAVAARSKLATIATNFYQIRAIVRCSDDESLGELPRPIRMSEIGCNEAGWQSIPGNDDGKIHRLASILEREAACLAVSLDNDKLDNNS